MMKNPKLFSREQVGIASEKGRQYSRPDSLSLVSRQSVLAFLLVLLTTVFGVGNAWAVDVITPVSGSQYRMKAVKTGTGAGTYYMVAPTSSGLGGTTTTEASGTIFTFTKESSNWYITFTSGTTTYYLYEHGSNGNVSISTTKTAVAIGTNGDYIKIGSSKWIQFNYNSGNPRMGCYSSSQVGVVLSEASSCSNTVTITKGAETNGTYTLSATSVCGDGDGEDVTISAITPAEGYTFDEITTSASGTVDNVNKKVTGITAATTITVKFKVLQKYTVSFNVGGSASTQDPITETTAGAGITLPAGPTPTCYYTGWEFAGWAATAVADETTTAPTLFAAESNYKPSDDCTLYAVYKRIEITGEKETKYIQVTALSQINAGGEFIITNGSKYLPSTTTTSSVAQADMVAITDGVVTGTVVDAMKWTFSAADEDGYVTIKNASDAYLYSTNSNTGLRVSNTADSWKFEEYTVSTVLGFSMKEKTNSRFCAVYTDGSDWRTYGSKDHTNYKTNSGRLDLYKKTEIIPSTTYYLSAPSCTPDFYIAGDFTSWGTNKIPVAGESKTVSLTAGDHQLKVIDGEAWKGFSNLTASEMIAGLYSDNDGNICFTLEDAGDVTVTYISEGVFKLAGDFTPQTVSVKGGWDSWAAHEMALSTDKKSASVKLTLAAANEVEFGIMVNSDFRANNYKYHRDFTGADNITGNTGNMKLTSDIAGDYIFTWTFGTNALNITFPMVDAGLEWSAAAATAYTVGKSYTLPTLTNEHGLGVTYSSTEGTVATISNEEGHKGEITLVGAGSTTIKATSAATSLYNAGEASYTLNVYAMTSVVVSGEATKTVYDKGEAFDHTGLVATANYGDETTLDVTDLATWTPDPATITAEGTVNVTAAWSGKTSEALEVPVTLKKYQLNYILPAQGTLSIKQNETLVSSGTKWVEGTQFTVSSTAPSADYKAGVYTVTDWGEPATDVTTAVLSGNTLTMPKYNVIVTVAFAEKPAAPINWSAATGKAYLPDVIDNVLPVLNNENSLTVSYSSSEELVAEIAANGALTIKKPGETTIKATYTATADGAYKTTEVSYTLTVLAPATVVVTGDATKKAYYYNETFSFDGLGAKATYADEAEYVIPAEEITWAPATAPVITADANIAVTATWQGITSAEKVIAVTKQLRELSYDEFKWASYATETLLQGYSAMPAVRDVIIPDGLSVSYRSGDPTVLTVNETTGAITELKKAGYVSMFVEFAGNDEYAAADRSYPIHVYGLDRIELSGAATKTAYETGDAFEHAGLVATAVYTLGSETPQEQVVTDLATWTPDPATIAANTTQVSVTAAWNGKTSAVKSIPVTVNTYAVTFTAPEHGTLVVKNGGVAISSGNAFAKGTVLTVEAAANAGYKLTALTAGGVDILESKEFTVGTAAVEVEATIVAKTAAGLSWPNATATAYTVGKSYTLQTLTNPHSLTVAYASSNTDVATINAETGAITVKADGSTVITATSAETDVYAAGEASYTLDVYGPAALAISGEATKTSYEKGDAFDRTGLVASVLYGDASELVVTDLATWTADPATVTANGNVTVTAKWEGLSDDEEVAVTVKTHKVIFDAPTNGSLEILNGEDAVASGAEFVAGTELTITATADQGYKLSSLTVNGEDFVSGETYTMGAQAVVVVATFVQDSGTALDNAEAGEQAEKIMLNNQLFILRGGKMYDAQGKLVK